MGVHPIDEITWMAVSPRQLLQIPFRWTFPRKWKACWPAFATAVFNQRLAEFLPKIDSLPTSSDAAPLLVPTLTEAYRAVLWRQRDATKNAISMAAQSMFSHKELIGKHGPEMQEMMWQKGRELQRLPSVFQARYVRAPCAPHP